MDKYTPYIFPALLVAWILYRRVKRTVGFQKYSVNSLVFRIAIFSIIALFLVTLRCIQPHIVIYDGVGLLIGFVLAYFAVRHAVFEKRNKGLYYRTHIWVEMTVLILFFARFLYRFYQNYSTFSLENNQSSQGMGDLVQKMKDPVTGVLFSILCAYYIAYYAYIYRTGRLKLMEADAGGVTTNSLVP